MQTYRVRSRGNGEFLDGVSFNELNLNDRLDISPCGILGAISRIYHGAVKHYIIEKTDEKITIARKRKNNITGIEVMIYTRAAEEKRLSRISSKLIAPRETIYNMLLGRIFLAECGGEAK